MENRKRSKHWDFMLLDAVALAISYLFAYLIRFNGKEGASVYRYQIIILMLAYTVVNLYGQPHKNILKRGRLAEFREICKFTLELVLIDIFSLFVIHEANAISRLFFSILWISSFVLLLAGRLLLKRYLRKIGHNSSGKSPAILIASSSDVQNLVTAYRKIRFSSFVLDGIFLTDYSEEYAAECVKGIPVKGGIDDVVNYATHHWVDEAMISMPDDADGAKELAKTFCMMGIKTHTVLSNFRKSADNLNVEYPELIGNYVVITQMQRAVPMYQWALKRTLDIIGGIVGCIVTAILFVFVAPAIYFNDPGPIFYGAQRVGKNGKLFKMYKFRSMYMNADARKKELVAQNKMSGGLMFKIDDDPRIIGSEKKDKNGKPKGIGNFIRKTSIDEFPQFWSVLIGDMSLCGTRPPTPDEYEKYCAEHKARLAMRPGISGLWQVSGRSAITDFDEVVELDTEYIRTWDFWLDLQILCKTVIAVLRHDGAE